MGGFHNRRITLTPKHIARKPSRQFPIYLFRITHAATQHDDVRVQHVDNGGQASGQVLQVLLQGFGGLRIAISGVFNNDVSGQLLSGAQFVSE